MKRLFRFIFVLFIILINYQFCNAQRIIAVVGNKFTIVRDQQAPFSEFVLISNFPQNSALTFQFSNTSLNNATVPITQLLCSTDPQLTVLNQTRVTPVQFLYNGGVFTSTTVNIPASNNSQIVTTGPLPCAVVILQYQITGVNTLVDITGFISTTFVSTVTPTGAIGQSATGGISVTGTGVVGAAAITNGTYPVSGSDGTFERRLFTSSLGSIRMVTPQSGSPDGLGTGNVTGPYNADFGATSAISTAQYKLNGNTGSPVWDRAFYCPQNARLSALGAATTQIVALSGVTKIRVCSIMLDNNNATATSVKLVEGTGANCATGQTNLTSNWFLSANTLGGSSFRNISLGADGAYITNVAGDALCVTSSAAGAVDVTITYTQY